MSANCGTPISRWFCGVDVSINRLYGTIWWYRRILWRPKKYHSSHRSYRRDHTIKLSFKRIHFFQNHHERVSLVPISSGFFITLLDETTGVLSTINSLMFSNFDYFAILSSALRTQPCLAVPHAERNVCEYHIQEPDTPFSPELHFLLFWQILVRDPRSAEYAAALLMPQRHANTSILIRGSCRTSTSAQTTWFWILCLNRITILRSTKNLLLIGVIQKRNKVYFI